MKINKHIANAATKSDNTHNDELLQHIWDNRGTKHLFNVEVVSVAKSGASRKMVITTTFKGRLIDVTHLIGDVLESTVTNGMLLVRGGGMDMVFSVLYQFYMSISSKQLKNNAMLFGAVNYYNLS